MTRFAYDPAIMDAFPALHGAAVVVGGVVNSVAKPALGDQYREEQARVAERLEHTPIADLPSIRAWRRAFSSLGVKPTQYRVAAEALLRRLGKAGDIPSINPLVDIGNLVSIRYALPVAVFDQRAVTGTTTVRHARGDERFTDLGSDVITNPGAGEVVFVDEADLVSARRWCWRQSAQSATSAETTDVLITIEGLDVHASTEVASACEDLIALIHEHVAHDVLESAILDRSRTSV